MKHIVKLDKNGLVVTLDDIAEFAGIKYDSVKRNILKHREAFERFGLTIGTNKLDFKYAKLDEYQATFLLTLMDNSPQVVIFKENLVLQFKEMRGKLLREQTKHNLITYKDGTKSVRKWLKEFQETTGIKVGEKQFINYLVMKGVIYKEPIVKTKILLTDELLGKQVQDGVAYNSNINDYIVDFTEGTS